MLKDKFSSAHIRNISEIGLVLSAENFQKDVDKLIATISSFLF